MHEQEAVFCILTCISPGTSQIIKEWQPHIATSTKSFHSNKFLKIVVDTAPVSYVTPRFPALYWPFPVGGTQVSYLYHASDIWRFTLYWTYITIVGVHIIAALYACLTQWRNWRIIWTVPVFYLIIGGIEATMAGNIVGGL